MEEEEGESALVLDLQRNIKEEEEEEFASVLEEVELVVNDLLFRLETDWEEIVDIETVSPAPAPQPQPQLPPSITTTEKSQRDSASELMSRIELMPVNGLTKMWRQQQQQPIVASPLVLPVLPQLFPVQPLRLLPSPNLPLMRSGSAVSVAIQRPITANIYTYPLFLPPPIPNPTPTTAAPRARTALPRPPAFTDLFSKNPVVAANAAAAAAKPVNIVPPQQRIMDLPGNSAALAVPMTETVRQSLSPQTITAPASTSIALKTPSAVVVASVEINNNHHNAPRQTHSTPATLQALKRKLKSAENSRSSSPVSVPVSVPSTSLKLLKLENEDEGSMPPPLPQPAPLLTPKIEIPLETGSPIPTDITVEKKVSKGRKKANWKWLDKESSNIDTDLEDFKTIAPELFLWNGQKPMIHLFVMKLLSNRHCLDLIEWIHEPDLMFKVKKPSLVARLWQHIKGNRTNNYECFARGIRHSRDIGGYFIAHGVHKKKVYKLTPKAVEDFHVCCPPTLVVSRIQSLDKQDPISGLDMLLEAAKYAE